MKNIKLYYRSYEMLNGCKTVCMYKIASEISIYLRVTLINDRRQDFEAPWIIIIVRCRVSNMLRNEYRRFL